jgi:DNA-binding NarL/FixJ family response regulator
MTVATLERQENNRGRGLELIFGSARDANRQRVEVLIGILEHLARLADNLLAINLAENGNGNELRGRPAPLLGSLCHEVTVQHSSCGDRKTDNDDKFTSLTPRQTDVLELLVKGMSNKEIARSLGLSEGTVKVHISGVFRALGVTNRAAAGFVGGQLLRRPVAGANEVPPPSP